MTLLIAFAVLSIGVSLICSVLEASLLSITPSFIAKQKKDHPKRHASLQRLKDRIDQPLAAILTLNTFAHTVGATGVGAQVALVFGDKYLGAASAVMTVLILVLSEILPKSIGARYWRSIAPFLPPILNSMILLLRPFIWLSDQIMKLFQNQTEGDDLREEIKALATLGRQMDELDKDEQRVIANILDLDDIHTGQIMTPRTVCEFIPPDLTVAEFTERIRYGRFSRYPVLDSDEAPLGMLFRFDMVHAEPGQSVREHLKPVKVVSDKLSVKGLMALFLTERQHQFLVYDEYGSWLGLVTMEDVIETILGKPIMDETDDIPNMRRYARRRWKHRLKKLEQYGSSDE